jgi:hypothetical protein
MKYICKNCEEFDFAKSFYHIVQREKLCLDCIHKRHNARKLRERKSRLSLRQKND